jgi:hypothetical protein
LGVGWFSGHCTAPRAIGFWGRFVIVQDCEAAFFCLGGIVELDKIRIDGGTQPREALSIETVTENTEAINSGATFPPVTVFHDGQEYWLADGFHRIAAHKAGNIDFIAAEIDPEYFAAQEKRYKDFISQLTLF